MLRVKLYFESFTIIMSPSISNAQIERLLTLRWSKAKGKIVLKTINQWQLASQFTFFITLPFNRRPSSFLTGIDND